MKIIQKYLFVLVLTAALLCIAVCCPPKADRLLPSFEVQSPDGSLTQTISIYNANDGNFYIFLPSYAQQEQLIVSQTFGQDFSINEIPLTEGMDFGTFHSDTPYPFEIDGQKIGAFWICKSANVATMYIDTVSGNMKYLHQNKNHRETVSVTLYTEKGNIEYSNALSTLNGRGNMTWEYDKRPYTLTLPADASLLDMAPGTKWILLANAADETNLNNKLIFDLAEKVGFHWTPDCHWVDLYLNGEYSGLYLLTEKVEAHENRLNMNTDAGDFLCKIDLEERRSTMNNPFSTGAGRTVEICEPRILKEGDLHRIETTVQEMEREIFSGGDLRLSTVIDLDSWVRRYLLDEIFANIDADLASAYFYSADGMLFAGPLWDYDMTLGNYPRNQDPQSFVAKNEKKSDTLLSPYYGAFCRNESFCKRTSELYRTEFLPALQHLMDTELDGRIEFLQDASRSNSLRWRSMYDQLPGEVVHTPDALKEYLSRRIQFLNRAWLEGTVYCTVQFESSPGSAYKNVSVEKGKLLNSPYINTETVIWVDSETGEVFDFSRPVTEDRILSKQIHENADQESQGGQTGSFSAKDLIIAVLLAVPLCTAIGLAAVDFMQRRKDP